MELAVYQLINGRPYRVQTTKEIDDAYLEFLTTPRQLHEIVSHFVERFEVDEYFAKGIHYTLSTRFFLQGRRVDSNFLAPRPKVNLWWSNVPEVSVSE